MSRGPDPDDSLNVFHPVVADWFRESIGRPTDVQAMAWPRIAGGEHLLAIAPTGSGKTLTAFLWALNQLLTETWVGGTVRVLYISPLKALNYDIERNLLAPLAELEARFAAGGAHCAPVRVMTRSGDTSGSERQRMVRRPPEILITTPESLNILLTSRGGRSMLGGLRSVILDEIHAVAGSKRGTHLITAVDRLVPLSGEFQRVALSATVRPAERVARFIGGYRMEHHGQAASYRPRAVSVVRSALAKRYDLSVAAPAVDIGTADATPSPDGVWETITHDLRKRIAGNRSTLVFANSRRVTEKVTRLINEQESGELAYSHHGSLSREIRSVVERRLKEGRLAAIVATNSLELGIDVGALDEVLLLQTPPTIASAVQRLGRAGHRVGEVSRGRLYPLLGRDFVHAAVVTRSVMEGAIEATEPIAAPLDVLAQIILSMTTVVRWDLDGLFDFLRASAPFHELRRRQFDLVVEMLAGRYADSRIRELAPRVSVDRVDNTITARPGSAMLVYQSGGTIPDRGYFQLRLEESMARLGELDEEFVWERSLGDTFTLGAQSWRIRKITHNDVIVRPAPKSAAMAPFWRAEERSRSFHLSERIGRFLEEADETLSFDDGTERLHVRLTAEFGLESQAAKALIDFLEGQRSSTTVLPHRRRLLVEETSDSAHPDNEVQYIFHTLWGGRVNRPLAIALAGAWEERHGYPLAVESNNDCLAVSVSRRIEPAELLDLVPPERLEKLLRQRLETTGFFGARFRENAGRALLLPRGDYRRRMPLWLNRQRAKKLLAAVSRYEDFPILVETWRTCLQDEFDLESLRQVLAEIARDNIHIETTKTASPSPFAADLVWRQTNRLMYEDDVPESSISALRPDLLRELVFSSQLRPRLPAALIDRLQRKLHRTFPDYSPQSTADLVDWVFDRVLIPAAEWQELLTAIESDHGREVLDEILKEAPARLVRIEQPRASAIASAERWPRLQKILPPETTLTPFPGFPAAPSMTAPRNGAQEESAAEVVSSLASEWLRFYGPLHPDKLGAAFALDDERLRDLLETLAEQELVVIDHFREGADASAPFELCDTENLERLLRALRAASRPDFELRPLDELPHFLAHWQGLAEPRTDIDCLRTALDRLIGYPAPARLWESDLLPARLRPYYTAWLDSLMQESELGWVGCGEERLTFAFPADRELVGAAAADDDISLGRRIDDLLPRSDRSYRLEEIAERTELPPAEVTRSLWRLAWQGRAANTTFLAVRRGLLSRFGPGEDAAPVRRQRPLRRRDPARWHAGASSAGEWFALDPIGEQEALDAVDREELNKDRARLLLDRYGVLFRELLARELPALRWSNLVRTLRIMELSGEVYCGHFFAGISGLQFASPAAYRRLQEGLPTDVAYWMNAADPASPCGLGLEELKGRFPSRLPSNYLVFQGSNLVVTARRGGAELVIRVDPAHPRLDEYLLFLKVQLTRQFDAVKAIDVETINGEPAAESPYAGQLADLFALTREHKKLRLRRRY